MQDFLSAVWLTIITLTTVGYGDMFPRTIGGKCTAIMTALWGTFVVSLTVLVVTNIFELKENEKKAVKYIKQCRSAATCINNGFRFYMLKKKFYIKKMERDPHFVHNSSFLRMINKIN